MLRLIDADEIKKREKDVILANGAKHRCFDTTMLSEIPTVDAVEVVRCKDCIHYWKNSPSDDVPVCLASPKDNAFCSEGERKEKRYEVERSTMR